MSATRIKGAEGVIIESQYFLELPKAPTKQTTSAERAGMIRYNSEWKSFEGVLEFTDGSVSYRRFANLDENGQLLTSQLPDSVTSGMQYIGTYSPLTDDIDPPLGGQYDKLPAPIAANSGQYYIVRGLYDAAQAHFKANNPTTPTVTFIPTNPSGQGNWIQIKYYVDTDPMNPSTGKVVIAAFGRIITASIPSTGHEGLTSLSTDTTLTAAFTTDVDKSSELALTDGDWIISDGSKQTRLRQSRVSISAGAVSFDRTYATTSGRAFSSSAGTVQTIIDNLVQDGLRRTGDSMYDDGGIGDGRLGVVYGTAAAPAIAFNSNPFNPTTNPGNDPTKWSETSTGIFRPATGSIGFSASGVERLRVSPTQLILYPSTGTAAAPNILFSATGNTALGINVTGNKIDFVSNSAVNVSLSQGLSTFNGNVVVTGNHTVNGNTTLGNDASASGDKVVVNSQSRFNGISTFAADAYLQNSANLLIFTGSTIRFNSANSPTTIDETNGLTFSQTGSTGNYNFILYNGASPQVVAKMTRNGFALPVMNPIDDSKGEDGMIAYSTQRNTVIQKSNGTWTTVGSGGGVITTFTTANWVLNGSYYTFTITNANIQQVSVQELSGVNYSPVEVDSVVISPTNAVLSVPASPDLRFNGRVIVQYQ
ncbi:hypothetical protein pEaSNUABM49_00221 [Erwinia phage pEa_SNUABM_49]|nr:hypothetical protein pEaSNUABM49_00221 [Erwinia phage pEa_SNUABM_49]